MRCEAFMFVCCCNVACFNVSVWIPQVPSSQTRTRRNWIEVGFLSFEMLPLIVDAEMMGWMERRRRLKIGVTITKLTISTNSDRADLVHFTAALWFVIWNGKMFKFNQKHFMTKKYIYLQTRQTPDSHHFYAVCDSFQSLR